MNEGFWALIVAIFTNYTVEESFRALNGKTIRVRTNWTIEDMEDIAKLRASGETWVEIAAIFGKQPSAVHHAFTRYRKNGLV